MAGGGACAWGRRGAGRLRKLRALVKDTQRALSDVATVIETDEEISCTVQELEQLSSRPPALVVLGRSAAARARLLHALLGRRLLPDAMPEHCRWIRIQYGVTTQVQLCLGNSDFELLEELQCSNTEWETLPIEDLRCSPVEQCSPPTVLQVSLPCAPLREGLQLLLPPCRPPHRLLSGVSPVYLYALDAVGARVFPEEFCGGLYGATEEECIFSHEHCAELRQLRELNANCQVMFVLLADSAPLPPPPPPEGVGGMVGSCRSNENFAAEATESTEGRALGAASDLPEVDQGLLYRHRESPISPPTLLEEQTSFMYELVDLWRSFCNPAPNMDVKNNWMILDDVEITNTCQRNDRAQVYGGDAVNESSEQSGSEDCRICSKGHGQKGKRKGTEGGVVRARQHFLNRILKFSSEAVQCYVLDYSQRLSEVHSKLLQQFILASFELARELQVVPKKIQYVAETEQQLYESIYKTFSEGEKKEELVQIMQEVLREMLDDVYSMDWSVDGAEQPLTESVSPTPPAEAEEAYDGYDFEDYEIIDSADIAGGSTETEVCESGEGGSGGSSKRESLAVQRRVLAALGARVSGRLLRLVRCLRQSYFGTLQRCLESLEESCREELGGRPASEAMRQVVSVARQVDLAGCASFPLLRALLDSLRSLLYRLRLVREEWGGPRGACWRRRVAAHTLHSLSAHALARLCSAQIVERVSAAHARYQAALATLQAALAGRLHHSEDVKLAIRRKYAPGFARLCLESTSMCDLLLHGMPELGKEIGRGQYGVVYACARWAGRGRCAVKSVMPADERHYSDLAMEFFYTRSIPAHPRVVRLLGSVVCSGGGEAGAGAGAGAGGGPPCVLLVCERKCRDLHAAVRAGMPLPHRLRVALDVVHGIRYLHSLGLVHRDVKLKNVLLDAGGRASLTDLGFCAAGALLSGSVVGTPVHMAPELLAGRYGAAVDVYAFGVLLWYICAGSVRLPSAFETFQNKEQLWSKVKRGLRPERLPQFSDECWQLMQACWHSNPARRPLPGDVQRALELILARTASDTAAAPALTPAPAAAAAANTTDLEPSSLEFYS